MYGFYINLFIRFIVLTKRCVQGITLWKWFLKIKVNVLGILWIWKLSGFTRLLRLISQNKLHNMVKKMYVSNFCFKLMFQTNISLSWLPDVHKIRLQSILYCVSVICWYRCIYVPEWRYFYVFIVALFYELVIQHF